MNDCFVFFFSLVLYIWGVIFLFVPLDNSPLVLLFAMPAMICGGLGMMVWLGKNG